MDGAVRGVVRAQLRRLGLFWARRQGEQLARVRNVSGSVAVGEQPIVSDAMEALRQHVDQEAPDELVSHQCHRLVAGGPLDPIVLVIEGDAVLVGGQAAGDWRSRCGGCSATDSATPAWARRTAPWRRPPN